jgi:hypothetical protein
VKEKVMDTRVYRGNERIAALCEAFPAIPRSIVIKTDVLREGTRHSSDVETAGGSSLPHFLIWNPTHSWNPQEGAEGGQLITIPWKFDLSDGTPVVIRFSHHSPYEIRETNGRYHLLRDGDPIEEVTFEPSSDWLFKTTSSGAVMTSIFLAWTREALLGCALRYCEYSKTGDQCVYCCLDADLKQYQRHGIAYDLAVSPENAAETYRAAYEEVGRIRNVSFTGGSLVNTARESERYIALFSALNRVRGELGADSVFDACMTPPPDVDTVRRLKEAGLDFIGPNMDCWEETLWPAIVPGKHKFVGRQAWIDSILTCVKVFGEGGVFSVFVIGPEMVPSVGFKNPGEATDSWRRCFEWLLSHGVVPTTSQWQVEVGSPWEDEEPPPTEYFLDVGLTRHQLLESRGAYGSMWHDYYKAAAWSTDADFRRLLQECRCDNCR